MSTVATDSRRVIEEYIKAMSGEAKVEEVVECYVKDESLKEHIRQTEAGFPGYHLEPKHMVAEDDLVAVHATFHGVHKGEFAGIAATGKEVSGELMIFYRISDGLIVEHWIQMDMKGLLDQLTA